MPSMQYGSLKPRTWWVPQSQSRPHGPQTRLAPQLTIGVFGQQVLGTHDRDFQGIGGRLQVEGSDGLWGSVWT